MGKELNDNTGIVDRLNRLLSDAGNVNLVEVNGPVDYPLSESPVDWHNGKINNAGKELEYSRNDPTPRPPAWMIYETPNGVKGCMDNLFAQMRRCEQPDAGESARWHRDAWADTLRIKVLSLARKMEESIS